MIPSSRRDFLVDVGRGMLVAGLGSTVAGNLGFSTAFADRGQHPPKNRVVKKGSLIYSCKGKHRTWQKRTSDSLQNGHPLHETVTRAG